MEPAKAHAGASRGYVHVYAAWHGWGRRGRGAAAVPGELLPLQLLPKLGQRRGCNVLGRACCGPKRLQARVDRRRVERLRRSVLR